MIYLLLRGKCVIKSPDHHKCQQITRFLHLAFCVLRFERLYIYIYLGMCVGVCYEQVDFE